MPERMNASPENGRILDSANSVSVSVSATHTAGEQPLLASCGTSASTSDESLRWLASFPELNSNPVTEIDLQAGAVAYLNPAARQVMPDLPTGGLLHPWTTGLEEIAIQLRSGRESSRRREVRVGDRWFDQTITCPLGGLRLRIYGVDITKRIEAQRQLELARSEAVEATHRLAAVMEMLPVGVALADFAGNHVRSNAMFHRIWGRPVPERATETNTIQSSDGTGAAEPSSSIPANDWASITAVSTGEPVVGQLVRIRRFDGAHAFVLNSTAPIVGPDGNVTGSAMAIMDVTERIEAEAALRESREDLNHAQAVARTGSWRLDLKNNQLLWSDETHRIFGVPKGTPLTYETFLNAVHPEDRSFVDSHWQAAIRGAPYDCEHRLAGEGPVRWVRERAVLEFGADGSLSTGFGTVQDITEKKEFEQALLRAKQEWERTFDAVPDLIAIIDPRHRIQRVNRAMAQRLNLSPEDCVGKHCFELVHGTRCPPGFCPHTCTVADRREHAVEVHEDRIGGDFLVTTTPLVNDNGGPIGSVHVARDITARKRAERLLSESEQRYRGLIELSPDAVLVVKEDRIVFLNPAGAKLFGATGPEDLLDLNLFDLLADEDRARLADPLWRIEEDYKTQIAPVTCTIVGLDHCVREAEVSAVPIQFDGASAIQLVLRDITESNRVQRSLRESRQRLAQAMLLGRCFAFEWNPETDQVFRAAESQPILGLTGDEVTHDTSQNYFRRVHPEDREAFINAVQGLKPAAETYRTKYRVLRPDGEVVILEEMGRATFNSEGRMVRLIGIAFDITERERNEAALLQSEQRYALAQRAANIASWEWDLKSNEVFWSDQIEKLLGFGPGEFRRTLQAFLNCVHHEDRTRVEQALRTAARGGLAYDVEHRILRPDGSIRWMAGAAEIQLDSTGEPARMVGIISDITRRKLAEEARADYLARVSTLVQVSHEILAEDSLPGLLKIAAAGAERITGAREALCGLQGGKRVFKVAAQRQGGADIPEAVGHVIALGPDDSALDWLESQDTVRSSPERAPLLPGWWRSTGERAVKGGVLGARLTARDGSPAGFLLLSDKSTGGFTIEDEKLLAQLAALVSVGQQRLEAKQEALRRSAELRTVFSAMAEMVIIYDLRGVPIQANPATLKLFGFDPAGCSIERIIERLKICHLDGRRVQPHEMPCQKALLGENVRNTRIALTDAAGNEYIVVASSSQLADGQQLLGAVCVWHDVTERERLLNELEQRVQERTAGLNNTVRRLEQVIVERQRAEAALAESEDQYRTLFQFAPVGIVMTDHKGGIHAANEVAVNFLGWSGQDFRTFRAQRFYVNRADRDALMQSVRQTGYAENLDLQIRRLDGKPLDVALRMNQLELRGQQMLMTLVQDLTQHKQAQKRDRGVARLLELFATQSSQQDYLEAVTQLLLEWCECRCAGIRLLAPSGSMHYAARKGFSSAFVRREEELFAQNQECACLCTLRGQTPPDHRPYVTPHGSFICNQLGVHFQKTRTGKAAAHSLPCAQARFESVGHVAIRFHNETQGAIHLADRRPNRFSSETVSFVEAISPIIGEALHRFKLEAELRDREQRLRSMFEHHDAIMLLIDPDTGAIRDANAAAARFYGYSEEKLRGMTMDDLNSSPGTRLMHEHERAAREHRLSYVSSQRLASGEIRTVEVHPSPVRVGSKQAHFCIIHDITDRKRLEQRILEIGDKERQSIGRDLHDSLGGNLTGIALISKGLAQALRQKRLPEKAIAEEVVEAVNQAISQARSIARGVCPVGLGRFGLVTGLQEYAVGMSKLFRIPCRFSPRGETILSDEQQATHLYRIAQEAITNAVRHGRATSIEIRLERRKHSIALSVKDDGVGFSTDSLPETGMGMRTMQYRAELIGARLKVTSAPGRGTLITCTLLTRPNSP